tara:strand:+ start:275 stop:685 length:411 start_codon:yes stop_codon:yes gene_type:complete
MKKSSKSSKIAKCLCGGIKLRIYGKLRHVSNCHCKQCMKTHGNFAAYTSCSEDQIKFINKKTLKWFKSSNFAKRGFCNKCGASIFYKKNKTSKISISAGMFNNPTKLKTKNNIFIKNKLDYYKLDSRLTSYMEYTK